MTNHFKQQNSQKLGSLHLRLNPTIYHFYFKTVGFVMFAFSHLTTTKMCFAVIIRLNHRTGVYTCQVPSVNRNFYLLQFYWVKFWWSPELNLMEFWEPCLFSFDWSTFWHWKALFAPALNDWSIEFTTDSNKWAKENDNWYFFLISQQWVCTHCATTHLESSYTLSACKNNYYMYYKKSDWPTLKK